MSSVSGARASGIGFEPNNLLAVALTLIISSGSQVIN